MKSSGDMLPFRSIPIARIAQPRMTNGAAMISRKDRLGALGPVSHLEDIGPNGNPGSKD